MLWRRARKRLAGYMRSLKVKKSPGQSRRRATESKARRLGLDSISRYECRSWKRNMLNRSNHMRMPASENEIPSNLQHPESDWSDWSDWSDGNIKPPDFFYG